MHPETPYSPPDGSQTLRNHWKNDTFRSLRRDWIWILSFSRACMGSIWVLAGLGMVCTGLSLAGSLVGKHLIDAIVSGDSRHLFRLLPLVVLTTVAGILFQGIHSRCSARLGIRMNNQVQAHVFDKLIHARWPEISRFSAGDLLNRFSGDVSTVSGCAVSVLPELVTQLFALLGTIGVILYYDPVMALIGCASTPALALLSRQVMNRQRQHNRQMRSISSDLSSFQSEIFRNVDTLKGFGVEDPVCARLEEHQSRYREAVLAYNRFSIRTHALMRVVSTGVQYLALGYCLWQLWNHNIAWGTLVLFLQLRSILQNSFSALIGLVPRILSGSVAAERLRELTVLSPEEAVSPDAKAPEACAVRIQGACAAYEPSRTVLSDVDFCAEPGAIVALIGPSGQGKTTMLRLILGLIRPVTGKVWLEPDDGPPICAGPAGRHCISYVPQGNSLLAGTVAENLKLAAPRATEEEMIRALKLACAWEFVENLPNGIHTMLGDGGKGLSEGQAQRLAIARALVRKAPVLLLDEVTSALDPETERAILENLSQLGLTGIITTHRSSVLSMCSRVYRVENGRLRQLSQEEISAISGQ